MKRFVFDVQDDVTRRITVLAKDESEARQKLENYDVESDIESECNLDTDGAKLVKMQEY